MINCLILGDPEDNIFTVEVDTGKNISGLRDAIKDNKEVVFRGVEASSITLCTTFKPYDEIKHTELPQPNLKPLQRIHQVFANLNPQDVHVIIKPSAGK